MCFPAPCARCGKTTWDGCGEHVQDVLATVPAPEQCACGSARAPVTPSGPALR